MFVDGCMSVSVDGCGCAFVNGCECIIVQVIVYFWFTYI